MTAEFPAFPDDPVASAVFDAHPPVIEDDITTWPVERLDELGEWGAALQGIELVDEPPPPPEHGGQC